MFHKPIGQMMATITLLSVTSQPLIAHAAEPPLVVTAEAEVKPSRLDAYSLDALRQDSKAKLTQTHRWVTEKTPGQDFKNSIKTLELKVDRFQDRIEPAGRSIKASVKKHAPGQALVRLGDRTVSAYGIMLILAFGVVIFLMSVSTPASRLGGRH